MREGGLHSVRVIRVKKMPTGRRRKRSARSRNAVASKRRMAEKTVVSGTQSRPVEIIEVVLEASALPSSEDVYLAAASEDDESERRNGVMFPEYKVLEWNFGSKDRMRKELNSALKSLLGCSYCVLF